MSSLADENLLGDGVTLPSEMADQDESSPSPFFFGFQSEEVPASHLEGETPYESVSGFNFGFNSTFGDRFEAVHSTINVTEFQTTVSGGLSAILFETDRAVISGRAMGGIAFGQDGWDDSWHTSIDLYGAAPLGQNSGNYFKLGAFVDHEEDFGKAGPALGLLLGADTAHPVTVDIAYGLGYGDPAISGQSIYSVADHDLQIQAGVAISPRIQLGVTSQYVRWDGVFSEEVDWKTVALSGIFLLAGSA
ncbi:MAG: hypothetical protein AAGA96_03995 [Verrucomicrobiota bacterium]